MKTAYNKIHIHGECVSLMMLDKAKPRYNTDVSAEGASAAGVGTSRRSRERIQHNGVKHGNGSHSPDTRAIFIIRGKP